MLALCDAFHASLAFTDEPSERNSEFTILSPPANPFRTPANPEFVGEQGPISPFQVCRDYSAQQ